MKDQFAGLLNGKQKAIGFIILLPLYFYVVPMFVNFLIFLYVKYINNNVDSNTLGVWLNFLSTGISLSLVLYFFKDFVVDNLRAFKEKLFENIVWCCTLGIGTAYLLSIIANLLISLFINTETNGAANQLLFEQYINGGTVLMVIQAVIFAPILEELLFRGLIFGTFRKYNMILGHFVSALVFGFIHIYTGLFAGDVTQLLYLFSYGIMGLAFSIAYEKRKTIFAPILIHMINNSVAVIVILISSKL